MDNDHDHDQDPDASPSPAAGERCPCCCSSSSSAVPWRRSVKRKLGAEKGKESGEAGDDEAGPAARVEAEDECAALREVVASA